MKNIQHQNSIDLLHGSIFRSILLFSVPIIISTLFQQLYNTVDVMLVGNLLGETSLAAIGASTPIYDLLVGFAVGAGNGLSVVTARCFGTGDRKLLRQSVATALKIAAGLVVFVTLLTQLLNLPLMRLLNTPEDILMEANSYISTITLFTAVTIAYNLCSGVLRAIGDSVAPMLFLMLSSLLNILLDIVLIRYTSLGIRGAAAATVISQCVSVLLSLIYIRKKHPELLPAPGDFRYQPFLLKEMLAQSISMGLMCCLVNVGTLVLQYGINSMGYLVIAGHVAARRIFTFCNIPFVSIGHAMATFSSQNHGAGQYHRIRRGIRDVVITEIGLAIIVISILFPLAPWFVRLLTGSEEQVIIENASRYVRFLCPFFPILGSLFTLRNSLQGLGEKALPLISSIIEMLAKVLFTVLLVPVFHYDAVIVCEPMIWVLMTSQLVYAFYTHPVIKGTWEPVLS